MSLLVARFVDQNGLLGGGEASNGKDAVRTIASAQPSLVLLDVSMPYQTGPEILPAILKASPRSKVVMMTSIADQETVTDCLHKGAAGYIRKDSSIEDISRLLTEFKKEISSDMQRGGADAAS